MKQLFETLGTIALVLMLIAEIIIPFIVIGNSGSPISPYLAWFFFVNFYLLAWIHMHFTSGYSEEEFRARMIFISVGEIGVLLIMLLGAIL